MGTAVGGESSLEDNQLVVITTNAAFKVVGLDEFSPRRVQKERRGGNEK